MATSTTIYITPRQRKQLFARARKRKTSFSEELRSAVDFYLDTPAEFDQEMRKQVAREASESIDRTIARLDQTLEELAKRRESR